MNRITRDQEDQLPRFSSHKQARDYFKEQYGANFAMQGSEELDGETIFFYHLVLNKPVYLAGREQLKAGKIVHGREYLDSYQAIEVFADGRIHVIH